MQLIGCIDDGYTQTGYIAAVPKVGIQALRFQFRLVTTQENITFNQGVTGLSAEDRFLRTAKLLKSHILSWDLKDRTGKEQPVEEKIIGRMPLSLYNRLYDIVHGLDGSDPDPNASEQEKADNAADKFPGGN